MVNQKLYYVLAGHNIKDISSVKKNNIALIIDIASLPERQ